MMIKTILLLHRTFILIKQKTTLLIRQKIVGAIYILFLLKKSTD